jgi:hypothetical protein
MAHPNGSKITKNIQNIARNVVLFSNPKSSYLEQVPQKIAV